MTNLLNRKNIYNKHKFLHGIYKGSKWDKRKEQKKHIINGKLLYTSEREYNFFAKEKWIKQKTFQTSC